VVVHKDPEASISPAPLRYTDFREFHCQALEQIEPGQQYPRCVCWRSPIELWRAPPYINSEGA
jgi:hypothetical protein